MMFYCKLAFPLSESEWCFTFLFVASCHIISLYSRKASVQLWVVKQLSPCDSPIAMPAAEHSHLSKPPLLFKCRSTCVVIIILLWWRDAAVSILKPYYFKR